MKSKNSQSFVYQPYKLHRTLDDCSASIITRMPNVPRIIGLARGNRSLSIVVGKIARITLNFPSRFITSFISKTFSPDC